MNNMVSVWEWVDSLNEWVIYRSYIHEYYGQQMKDALNKNMQAWRKERGDHFEIFPYGINPNNKGK